MEPYLHLPDDNTGVDSLAKFYVVPSPLLYMGRTDLSTPAGAHPSACQVCVLAQGVGSLASGRYSLAWDGQG